MKQKLTLRLDTNTYTILDIRKEIEEDVKLLSALGYTEALTNTYDVKLSNRSKKMFGCCKSYNDNFYGITINENYLRTAKPENIHELIMHEVIHSLNGCMNHGYAWKSVAAKVNRVYNFKTIERLATSQEYDDNYLNSQYKHRITCDGCHKTWGWLNYSSKVRACIKGKCTCKRCGSKSFTYTYIGG